jgi:SAM-dependent methyltransferase
LQTFEQLAIDSLVKGKQVLHFAPEPILTGTFGSYSRTYKTADLLRGDVDLNLDMCAMDDIADNSFDLVVACDVLEHVQSDSRALDELHRILCPGGWAILTVPQKDNLDETYEDASITTAGGRLQAFGQEDHLRIYGSDFVELLNAHGFSVRKIDETDFEPSAVKKHVLFPPVLSSHPLATNYRKVFFGQKF